MLTGRIKFILFHPSARCQRIAGEYRVSVYDYHHHGGWVTITSDKMAYRAWNGAWLRLKRHLLGKISATNVLWFETTDGVYVQADVWPKGAITWREMAANGSIELSHYVLVNTKKPSSILDSLLAEY